MLLVDTKKSFSWVLSVSGGSCLIWLGAWMQIPFYPVPFTLQTLALFWVALTQPPRQALGATLFYLFLGSCGLPVFATPLGPFWWMGKTAGYLLAFPLVAYFIAKIRPLVGPLIAVLFGNTLLLSIGFAWLIPFVGVSFAWSHGLFPFLFTGYGKALVAYASVKGRKA